MLAAIGVTTSRFPAKRSTVVTIRSEMCSTLRGVRVLITGASRGIGLALTRAYLARGENVVATIRAENPALTALAQPRLELLTMDVTSTESVRTARRRCTATALEVLIDNAGVSGRAQHAPGMDLARADNILSVNALGPLRVYDAFVDLVRLGDEPRRIVHVSSEAGSLGKFRTSSKPEYAMSKAALNALTRWVAATEPSIVCVSIHPGWTRTDLGGSRAPQSPERCAERMVAAIDALMPAHSGTFVDAELRPMPW